MSKPRTIKTNEGTRQAPVKQVLLEIIANRTGSVSSDEILGALINGWELPQNLKQNPRQWVAVMLAEIAKLGFITKTGTHHRPIICENGMAGAVNLAMYDIAPAGVEFLAKGGGVVPKYKPLPPPLIDEDGTLIPRDGLSAHLAWKAPPRCKWRDGKPTAMHMYTGEKS
jgi:hypothetical protein